VSISGWCSRNLISFERYDDTEWHWCCLVCCSLLIFDSKFRYSGLVIALWKQVEFFLSRVLLRRSNSSHVVMKLVCFKV
jgi:hypothetical protein